MMHDSTPTRLTFEPFCLTDGVWPFAGDGKMVYNHGVVRRCVTGSMRDGSYAIHPRRADKR